MSGSPNVMLFISNNLFVVCFTSKLELSGSHRPNAVDDRLISFVKLMYSLFRVLLAVFKLCFGLSVTKVTFGSDTTLAGLSDSWSMESGTVSC